MDKQDNIQPEALGHQASHERVHDVKLSEWDTWVLLESVDEMVSIVMNMEVSTEEWRTMYIGSLRELEQMLGNVIQEVQRCQLESEGITVELEPAIRHGHDYWH